MKIERTYSDLTIDYRADFVTATKEILTNIVHDRAYMRKFWQHGYGRK
jgi:hypothetical protein